MAAGCHRLTHAAARGVIAVLAPLASQFLDDFNRRGEP